MEEPSFKLGLALAGAISAGAYTAGVIDFLTEALEAFEVERGKGDVPGHRVGVKVVAGASAGAVAGALGLIAMARGIDPRALSEEERENIVPDGDVVHNPHRCVLPALYEAWVERPRLVAEQEGGTDFLDVADLKSTAEEPVKVGAVLNSTVLDKIKEAALRGTGRESPPARPYLAEKLHLYLTVSNLRGIPFRVAFGNEQYGTLTHGDRIHYKLSGFGKWLGADTAWAKDDPGLDLDAGTLPKEEHDPIPTSWGDYGTAALASAAFPIGLASRPISTPVLQFQKRSWPFDGLAGRAIDPQFPVLPGPAPTNFKFRSVNGGLINNSPFDYAEFALLERPPVGGSATPGAVIMVAPFPKPPEILPEGEPEPEISALIRALVPTLIGQARFRLSDLVKGADPKCYDRFMIVPRRVPPKGNGQPEEGKEAEYPIACGALGGFGGFLDRQFRAHDYQLGRRNCQAFLRNTFALPFGAQAIESKPAYRILKTGDAPETAAILPLVGEAALDVALPAWPRMKGPDLDVLNRRIETRLDALAPILIDAQTGNRFLQWIGRLGLMFGKPRLLDGIRFAILSDLIRRDQVEGFPLTRTYTASPGTVRAVAAELASPTLDYRTRDGIARKLHLAPDLVGDIIAQLKEEPGDLRAVAAPWDADKFTLQIRARQGVATWPGIGSVVRWFIPPSHDRDVASRPAGAQGAVQGASAA